MEDPVVVATTGWTTDELLADLNTKQISDKFDLVTLLIGVNNQYRGYPVDQYVAEFELLLQRGIKWAGGANKVIVISIPDWGTTPFAEGQDLSSSPSLRPLAQIDDRTREQLVALIREEILLSSAIEH